MIFNDQIGRRESARAVELSLEGLREAALLGEMESEARLEYIGS